MLTTYFCIVKKTEIDNTLNVLNSYDRNVQFTHESEEQGKLAYLDALIIRQGNELILDWYQKPTASGRLINYYSKHPRRIKINTAVNFIKRVHSISDERFQQKN